MFPLCSGLQLMCSSAYSWSSEHTKHKMILRMSLIVKTETLTTTPQPQQQYHSSTISQQQQQYNNNTTTPKYQQQYNHNNATIQQLHNISQQYNNNTTIPQLPNIRHTNEAQFSGTPRMFSDSLPFSNKC